MLSTLLAMSVPLLLEDNPIFSIQSPSALYRMHGRSQAESERAIATTNHFITVIAKMPERDQVRIQNAFISACEAHLESGLGKPKNYRAWGDVGILDTIAVALGKKPVVGAYLDLLPMRKLTGTIGVELSPSLKFRESQENAFSTLRIFPATSKQAVDRARHLVNTGYFVAKL